MVNESLNNAYTENLSELQRPRKRDRVIFIQRTALLTVPSSLSALITTVDKSPTKSAVCLPAGLCRIRMLLAGRCYDLRRRGSKQ